jgi:GT2 family glycosyltransferase
MYYEETEISTRLLKLGLKINRTPKAKCYHLENYSSPKKHADGIAFRQHMAVQNRWYMIGVNWPLCLLPKAIMVNILHLLYLQFFFFKNKQFNKLNLILKAPEKLILGLYQRNNYLKDKYWYKHLKRTSISTYFFNKKAVFNRKPPN